MICFHSRYRLGDDHNYNHNDYGSWDEMKEAILKNEDVVVIKPLYLYDHSGITISTSPFGCRWDSGQIGFVIVTKDSIRNMQGVKRVTKRLIEIAEECLDAEVKTYDMELTGDVYGFTTYDAEGNQDDSCGGFYGDNFEENGMLGHISDDDIVEKLKEEVSIF